MFADTSVLPVTLHKRILNSRIEALSVAPEQQEEKWVRLSSNARATSNMQVLRLST